MNTPNTTYRIQFHKQFNFDQFEQTIGYLHALGIDYIYASPILAAVSGSMHGYDGTDMERINPEIGTLGQFKKLRKKLKHINIHWLQDIVPNHMALHPDNAWLMDVLRFGKSSTYSGYFDTVFSAPYIQDEKLMIPILGDTLENCLKANQIQVVLDHKQLHLEYQDTRLPLNPMSYPLISENIVNKNSSSRLEQPERTKSLLQSIRQFNGNKQKLRSLLAMQHYRLCHWQETDDRINYRRFFTVNGLICLNMEAKSTFDAAHAFVKQLITDGWIQGLRIDHIDGIHNPNQYLKWLRSTSGKDIYIIAEKILEKDEVLLQRWPIQGTTGYEFLALSNNVCTDRKGKKKLNQYYEHLIGMPICLEKEQYRKKEDIITNHLQGEVDNLAQYFLYLNLTGEELNMDDLKNVLKAFLIYFPVYRLYDDTFPLSESSFRMILDVFDKIAQEIHSPAVRILRDIVEYAQYYSDTCYREKVISFLLRCMQFTGPVMAKGVEDTLMYTFNRFIAHNEVGNHPANFGISKKDFHERMLERQRLWPSALNASATHDTKRGEDTRARLLVLSCIAPQWTEQVKQWEERLQEEYPDKLPHSNDRYFVYQSLYGAHPMPGQPSEAFSGRFRDYLIKYLREGKEHSSWTAPNTANENALLHFAEFLINPKNSIYPSFLNFLESTADFGIFNALTLLILKFTCPGIPDIYQGTELWDFSFVDPDNRRPVDYAQRMGYLTEIQSLPHESIIPLLWKERNNGKIKLWLLQKLIKIRKTHDALGKDGDYIALKTTGRYRRHILAYARVKDKQWIVTVVPLHVAGIPEIKAQQLLDFDWEDTKVQLPQGNHPWEHLLAPLQGEGNELQVSSLFKELPLAVLRLRIKEHNRRAGILLPVTALPGDFGIGDLGSTAFSFVNHLKKGGQSYWQVLPVGPVCQAQYYSPYSTLSAMAGNPLLIDLEELKNEGLLTSKEYRKAKLPTGKKIDYPLAETNKFHLLSQAYKRVDFGRHPDFQHFCTAESSWLDDYALFIVLYEKHQRKPWYQWPEIYKLRDQNALSTFGENHFLEIRQVKWIQYLFFKQWKALQQHCRQIGVRLIGDIPFYVSHNSADTWCNQQFFSLKTDGTPLSLAGVPPDYFSKDGQLWGMPTYHWENLKQDNYCWWINRLKQQCRLFDLVRLDHFRAFSAYWKVDAGQETAQDGAWEKGPDIDFFDALKAALPEMPFIVEDLGDIDASVYALRDAYALPGMRVLQFAFGEDMPHSLHIPHNFDKHVVAYTGTHDNNTLKGWYQNELNDTEKARLAKYCGHKITKTNVSKHLIRLAYASIADTVIIPMPDILKLGQRNRINNPAQTVDNWLWRMRHNAFDTPQQKKLKELTYLYKR